eukprot:754412-Hanusia_phi.AAC.1
MPGTIQRMKEGVRRTMAGGGRELEGRQSQEDWSSRQAEGVGGTLRWCVSDRDRPRNHLVLERAMESMGISGL